MTYARPVDKKATKIARARQQRGIDEIASLFAVPTPKVMRAILGGSGDQSGRGTPVRMRAGCPPVRDREHQRKHKLRKIRNESRRRNRRS